MRREDLNELHYITPIDNVPSIIKLGILSHAGAAEIEHVSVAMDEIQQRRARVVVPGGRPLHEYANLYLCARNPMTYKRRNKHADLCVLRVGVNVLDHPGVVVTDGNAASDYTRFAPAPEGLAIVDEELTFAEYWTDADEASAWRKKRTKCAEVLVPNYVNQSLIYGVYVSNRRSLRRFNRLNTDLNVDINGHIFFR